MRRALRSAIKKDRAKMAKFYRAVCSGAKHSMTALISLLLNTSPNFSFSMGVNNNEVSSFI